MKSISKFLPPLALVGALALVPVTASSFAATDTTNYQELEKFMSVYERVKANYVEPVDDKVLIKGVLITPENVDPAIQMAKDQVDKIQTFPFEKPLADVVAQYMKK